MSQDRCLGRRCHRNRAAAYESGFVRENSLVTFALLFPAVLLLATSLLAIFRAPTHFLWMVTVGVTEFGHYLGFICLGAAVVFAMFSGVGRAAAIISVIAAA